MAPNSTKIAGSGTRSRRRPSRRGFSSAFEPELRYAPGVARFLTGTPNVPALYAATAGYDLVEEVGVERIRANSLVQTDLLIRLADEAGFEVRSPRDPARRGGTVTVHVPDNEVWDSVRLHFRDFVVVPANAMAAASVVGIAASLAATVRARERLRSLPPKRGAKSPAAAAE